jgi:hypothetical protein
VNYASSPDKAHTVIIMALSHGSNPHHLSLTLVHHLQHPPTPCTQVAVNYASSPDKAEEVAAEIAKLGGEAITVGCNVAKREELEALFKTVTDKWGAVDVLVNNAGMMGMGMHTIFCQGVWGTQACTWLSGDVQCALSSSVCLGNTCGVWP